MGKFSKLTGLACLLMLGFWLWKENVDIHRHSWLYRTFLQTGFNAEIVVQFEFDHKQYQLRRILRCKQEAVSSQLSHTSYGFFPDYYAFGLKADTGEGIIISTPAVCQERSWKRGDTLHQWSMNIPLGHRPLMAIADKADDPSEIYVYASHQAYTSQHSRLNFIKMEIKPAEGIRRYRFFSDAQDQFAAFGPTDSMDKEYLSSFVPKKTAWFQFTFVKIPKDIWDSNNAGLFLPQTLRVRFRSS